MTIETIKNVRASVVRLVCIEAGSAGRSPRLVASLGTGFLVNVDGHVLTAAHVIQKAISIKEQDSKCQFAALIPVEGWGGRENVTTIKWYPIGHMTTHPRFDIGFVRLAESPFKDTIIKNPPRSVVLATSSDFPDGTPVAFSGFPFGLPVPITSQTYIAAFLPADKEIVVNTLAGPGASGAPLYLSDGRVVGVVLSTGIDVSTGSRRAAGLTHVIAVEVLTEFLRSHSVPFEQKK